MKFKKIRLEISCYTKNGLVTDYFIRINPYNVLSNWPKFFFQKAPFLAAPGPPTWPPSISPRSWAS